MVASGMGLGLGRRGWGGGDGHGSRVPTDHQRNPRRDTRRAGRIETSPSQGAVVKNGDRKRLEDGDGARKSRSRGEARHGVEQELPARCRGCRRRQGGAEGMRWRAAGASSGRGS